MSIFVGLDVGTQSVKLVAYDLEAGEVVQTVAAPLELIAREDGSREQLADWWITALRQCFGALDPQWKRRVAGIGVSGQQHGLVALDASGAVLSPVKLWCDTSTSKECAEIAAAVGGHERCIEIAGNPILPGYTASKVRWLRKAHPLAYARLATIMLPHDYVNFYLTGERFTECGDASGTGWFDVRRRTWSPELLGAIDADRDLSRCMPALLDPDRCLSLAGGIAGELGLPPGAVVSVGGGDNMMAAIGTRTLRPGRLTLSLGTSGTLFARGDRPMVDTAGQVAAFCDSAGGWLPLICTMNCTVATEQIRKLTGISLADADALVASTEPGANGVVTLPFYNGERTPNLPHARASIRGLDLNNATAANLLRSAMEGASFGLRYGFEQFAQFDVRFESICITGGGSASGAWRQMIADIFRLPVFSLAQQESAALGAALQSAHSYLSTIGHRQSLADFVDERLVVDAASLHHPEEPASARYELLYRRYSDLLTRTFEETTPS
jgi:xylulokinase